MSEKYFIVYIMTNRRHTVLYIGMSGRGEGRLWEHAAALNPRSFTARYHLNTCVYIKSFDTATEAAEVERTLKGWNRQKKIALINSSNPEWRDLTLS